MKKELKYNNCDVSIGNKNYYIIIILSRGEKNLDIL